MKIQKIIANRRAALALAWEVFLEFEAPEYPPEGVASFRGYLNNPQAMAALDFYGAYKNGTLAGMLAVKEKSHISLFFVRREFQRQGIGRAIFTAYLAQSAAPHITVNSSPYAVPIYERLGFSATAPEQLTDGIRYTPMVYQRKKEEP